MGTLHDIYVASLNRRVNSANVTQILDFNSTAILPLVGVALPAIGPLTSGATRTEMALGKPMPHRALLAEARARNWAKAVNAMRRLSEEGGTK